MLGSFFGGVENYGYTCSFQKTNVFLVTGVVKEPGAGASVHLEMWDGAGGSSMSSCSWRKCVFST